MIKIMQYGQVPNSEIFARVTPGANVEAAVEDIIAAVRARGDQAVLEFTQRFDGVRPEPMLVSQQEVEEAFAAVEPEFLAVLEQAAQNIRAFHYIKLCFNKGILFIAPVHLIGASVAKSRR